MICKVIDYNKLNEYRIKGKATGQELNYHLRTVS